MGLGYAFDATCGFPGEGLGSEVASGGRAGGKEARGFLKIGIMNVTASRSFKDDFEQADSELRNGHVWAIQEHKLSDEHACAQA